MSHGAGQPAAGWYPDPGGSGGQRWWDGSAWTEHVTAPAAPGGGAYQGAPGYQPYQGAPSYQPYHAPKRKVWPIVVAVAGVLFVLFAIFLAIAIPTFLGAQDRAYDRDAQATMGAALIAVDDVYGATGTYAAATPEALTAYRVGATFTGGDSRGDDQVSVFNDAEGILLAVQSNTGTCWAVRIQDQGPTIAPIEDYGRIDLDDRRPCIASAGLSSFSPDDWSPP